MSDSESTVRPGQVLAERYRLTEEIGRGGFGMVYRARQLNMDRDVAIKILPPKFMSIPDVVERFRREARLASRLRHPNTITVHDYGKQDNLLFIVMELLEGEDVADVLMRKPTLSMDRILHIGRQVLKSLNEAHSHNIIHRDLKPENIFLTGVGGEEDFVKVLDFGIAKLAMPDVQGEEGNKLRKLTMSGSTVGTPTYMSPEQAAGEEVDALTDLYALGVILYEMACGRPPFKDDNPVKVMRSHLFEEVPRFPKGPLRDSRFESVIRKALSKDKAERISSAKEFLKALKGSPTDLLDHHAYEVEPPTVELPDLAEDGIDSGDIAFDRTAAYQVESSDAMSPRSPHNTDTMLAAQDSTASDQAEASAPIPFESLPADQARDRVTEGAVSSSLTDISNLSSNSDLHARSAPPGFESGSSSSSIITVLEPGPDDEVILLTNKKDEADPTESAEAEAGASEPPAAEASASAEAGHPAGGPPQPVGVDSPLLDGDKEEPSTDAPTAEGDHFSEDFGQVDESVGGEWSWGEKSAEPDDIDGRPLETSRRGKAGLVWALVLLFAAVAAVGYLQYAGIIELF